MLLRLSNIASWLSVAALSLWGCPVSPVDPLSDGGLSADVSFAGDGTLGADRPSTVTDGGASGVDAALPEMAPRELCLALLDLFAGRAAECQGGDYEQYVARAGPLSASYCTRMVESVQTGRARYDGQAASACVADLSSTPCDVLRLFKVFEIPYAYLLTSPDSCQQVLQPSTDQNAECEEDWECEAGLRCDRALSCTGQCSFTCLPVDTGGLGEACGCLIRCSPGQICQSDGTCGETLGPGDACAGVTTISCSAGSFCSSKSGLCEAVVAEGGCDRSARGGYTACWDLGLVCAGPTSAQSCRTAKRIGDACTPGRWECAPYAYCRETSSGAGACTLHPVEGESCATGLEAEGYCWGGAICGLQGGLQTCVTLGSTGDSCSDDSECWSGACVDRQCAGAAGECIRE